MCGVACGGLPTILAYDDDGLCVERSSLLCVVFKWTSLLSARNAAPNIRTMGRWRIGAGGFDARARVKMMM